jgi:hypothetical protein
LDRLGQLGGRIAEGIITSKPIPPWGDDDEQTDDAGA